MRCDRETPDGTSWESISLSPFRKHTIIKMSRETRVIGGGGGGGVKMRKGSTGAREGEGWGEWGGGVSEGGNERE